MFNIYNDTLAENLYPNIPRNHMDLGHDLTLFADNFKLQAKIETELQEMPTGAERWAIKFGMTWSVGKCEVLAHEIANNTKKFELSGQEVQYEDHVDYLGSPVHALD